jgi:hypothetical protein
MTGLLELTASALQVCRLQAVEKAMRWLLNPGRDPVEIRSARKALGRVERDVTVMSGSAAPFVHALCRSAVGLLEQSDRVAVIGLGELEKCTLVGRRHGV